MKRHLLLLIVVFLSSLINQAEVVNVAENGTPATSSPLWPPGGWDIHMLTDGNTSSVFHLDSTSDPGSNYTLDLGKEYAVQEIRIYPRQDGCCAERLRQIRVSVNKDNAGTVGAEVWGTDLFTDGSNAGSVLGAIVKVPLPSPATGRWIKVASLEDPVSSYGLQMTELEVYAEVPASEVNRALGALVTASQPLFGGQQASSLVDGNRGNVVHGAAGLSAGFAFAINLGTVVNLSRIVLWPRQDTCCAERLTNFRVSIHNDDNGKPGAALWSTDLHTDASSPPSDPGTKETLLASLDAAGTFKGQWIRIESLDPVPQDYALQFAEVEAFGEIAGAANLLLSSSPKDTVAGLGQTATFSVVATAPGGEASKITYQWQKNGVDIPGATSSTYTTPLLGGVDDKAKFRAVVSYPGLPSQTSAEAALRINLAYHAAAATTAPLWGPGGWTIANLVNGNRNDVFHLDAAPPDGAAYEVNLGDVIKFEEIDIYPRQDGCCAERLANFRVSIHTDDNGKIGNSVWSADLFTDETNPASTAGSIVKITADLNAGGKFEGQWIRIQTLDQPVRDYALQMTELEAFGSFSSSVTTLSITSNPGNVAAGLGAAATLSVGTKVINGDPTKIGYQWQRNGVNVPGGTNATLTTVAIAPDDDNSKYKVIVSYPGLASQTSAEATLRVNYAYHAKVSTTSPLWAPGNWSINNLVNGDRKDVFHLDTAPASGAAYQIDLGASVALEEIEIWPRQDGCCGERLANIRVSVHNDKNGAIGDPVWTADFFTDGTNPGSQPGTVLSIKADRNPSGKFEGRWIQIQALDDPVQDYALQMTELEVYGVSNATSPAPSILIGKSANGLQITWTSGTLQSASTINGSFTPVSNATSPYSVTANESQRFYRVQ